MIGQFFHLATHKCNRLLLVQMDFCVKMWNDAGLRNRPVLFFPSIMLMQQNCLKAPSKKQLTEEAAITFISFKSMPLLGFCCNESICFDILQQKKKKKLDAWEDLLFLMNWLM